jgi:type I restriction enzyme, S subunit
MGGCVVSRVGKRIDVAELRRFRPYPAYKNSGVEWLGQIPQHWNVRRLKHLAILNPESLAEDTDPTMEMVYVDIGGVDSLGRIVEKEQLTFGSAPTRARRLARDGDVVVSTVRTYLRAIAPIINPESNMVVSTGFAVVRPAGELTADYAAYALRAPHFVERVVANSKGVSFPATNESEMATYELAVPPIVEQRAIAAFLNRETAKIDTLVEKKERLVDLLQEKRTTLITRAVTKGLDPNVPMKGSGVQWLGQIPSHWEVKPLRWALSVRSGGSLPNTDFELASSEDYVIPVIGGNGIMGYGDSSNTSVPSIAIGRVGALCGNVHLVNPPAWVTDNALLVSEIKGFAREYLALLLESLNLNQWASQNAQPLITGGFVKAQLVCCPPLPEQQDIVDRVRKETTEIDTLIERVCSAMGQLKELRTALISAAVTGKIDV